MKQANSLLGSPPRLTWFWFGMAAVALITLIAGWTLYLERRCFLNLQHAYAFITSIDDLLSKLNGLEAERRGYLLTGEATYLELFNSSGSALERQLDALRNLASGAKEENQVKQLEFLIPQELEELRASIPTHDESGFETTPLTVATDRQVDAAVRQVIHAVKLEEQSKVARFFQEQSKLQAGFGAIFGSDLLAMISLVVGQVWLRRGAVRLKKAEEGWKVSKSRFETLCEQAPVGIYEADAQGFCVYTNPRWSEMSGLSGAESLGHGWAKVLHPDDRATVFEGWEQAARQGAHWEYRLLTPRGEVHWIRALGGPIYSAQGDLTGYVGTLEDVTERKVTERALQDREAFNRAVLNSLPANIAVLKADGKIQAINEGWQRFARANGVPRAYLVGNGVDYLEVCKRAAEAGSKDAEKALKGIQDVLAGKLQSFEMQYPCHSASERRWFHMAVIPLAGVTAGGAVIAHVNITHRKRAEERFRLVFEAAPNAMVMVDREGKIVLVNSLTEKLFGYGRKELLEQPVEILIPESSQEIHAALRGGLFAKPQARPMELRQDLYARRKDGTEFPVEIGLNPIETEEGIWVLSSIVDITERQRADRTLRENRQELRALAERLINAQEEERRRISRQLHDDLSQRLALLAFDTGSLVLAPPAADEMKETLRNLQAKVVQLSQDVRQIAHQLHPSILDDLGLTAALGELCEEFSAREGIEVAFQQEAMPDALPMEVASCLYGVAQEALHNVSKHAGATQVRLMVSGSPEGVHLSIRDEGAGFDAKTKTPRHGLGIISMKERVRSVQGEFSIHSEPGRGTTVTVSVPLSKETQ